MGILLCLVNCGRNLSVPYFYPNRIRFRYCDWYSDYFHNPATFWCCDKYANYTFTTLLHFGPVANSRDNGRTKEANVNLKRIQSASHEDAADSR